MVSYPNDYYTYWGLYGGTFFISATGPKNPYDCCVACFTQFNCVSGLYNQGLDFNGGGACNFNTDQVCDAQAGSQVTADYIMNDNDNPAPVFNGNCGEITYAQYIGD